ncbi:hypothetical protein HanXRQr2_Chr02g0085751 [Helianthus annuus]|uniref:Uncharacterized protein n=1 Tax=Helianthus annuus TaxID=4232 RepID=A0A9K3JQX1_HELAN|nr:hypothetical protein HanXRQr2_Chr02g0085751 [Helianthus annuus]
MSNNNPRNRLFTVTNRFLQRTPPLLILQTPIRTSKHEHFRSRNITKLNR